MPACCVWECGCGIKWKANHDAEGPKQTHVCMCTRTQEAGGGPPAYFTPAIPDF